MTSHATTHPRKLTDRTSRAPDGKLPGWLGRVAILAMTFVSAAGCAAGAPENTAKPGNNDSPDRVALAYTEALLSGDANRAMAFVLPQDRSLLQAVAAGLKNVRVVTKELAVGSSTVRGDEAVVVLTGKICTVTVPAESRKTPPTTTDPSCVSNVDAASSDPIFRVMLAKPVGGSWLVTFPAPARPTGTSPQPVPLTSNSTAVRR